MMESLEIIKRNIEKVALHIGYLKALMLRVCEDEERYKQLKSSVKSSEEEIKELETIMKDLKILQIFKKNISYEVYEKSVKVRDDENDYEYYENELTPYIAIEIHNVDDFEIVNDWDVEQKQKACDNK